MALNSFSRYSINQWRLIFVIVFNLSYLCVYEENKSAFHIISTRQSLMSAVLMSPFTNIGWDHHHRWRTCWKEVLLSSMLRRNYQNSSNFWCESLLSLQKISSRSTPESWILLICLVMDNLYAGFSTASIILEQMKLLECCVLSHIEWFMKHGYLHVDVLKANQLLRSIMTCTQKWRSVIRKYWRQ